MTSQGTPDGGPPPYTGAAAEVGRLLGATRLGYALGVRERAGLFDAEPVAGQRRREKPPHRRFVFDDEDRLAHDASTSAGNGSASGNHAMNRVPPPSRGSVSIPP